MICSLAIIVGLGFIGLVMADDDTVSIDKKVLRVGPGAVHQSSNNQSFVVPPNDECAGALVIPDGATNTGDYPVCSPITNDVLEATPIGGPSATDPPSCLAAGQFISNSVWYQWTPSVTQFYNIYACSGASCSNNRTLTTDSDGVLVAYTSTAAGCSSGAGPFVQVGCNDDGCHGSGPSIIGPTTFTAGVTYYILAGNWTQTSGAGTGAINQYQLRIQVATPPPNDTCATAEPLVLNMPTSGFVNQLANDNYQVAAACYAVAGQVGNTPNTAPGRDVTYSFTAPDEDDYSFYMKYYNSGPADTAPDSILYLSGTCPVTNGTIPSCLYAANRNVPVCGTGTSACTASTNRRQGGSEYALCVHLTAGQTVFPIVDATTFSPLEATFRIEASRCHLESEFNGTPASAENPAGDGSLPPNSATAACPVEGQILTFVPANPDIDFYTLGTNPGSRVFTAVNCDGMNPNDTGTGINLDMRLTTTTDTLEYDDQDMAQLFATLCPNIEGAILPAGPAYLRINHFTPATSAEPYRLHTTIRAPGAGPLGTSAVPEDPEPNDAVIQFHDYVYGNHPPPAGTDDYDYFGFSARKGDMLMINSDGDPTKDNTPERNFLVLFDPSGNAVPVSGIGVSAVAASNTTSGAGSLTSLTPRFPGDAIVHRAQATGLYIGEVTTAAAILGAATPGDYLYQASVNCNTSSTGGGITADLSIVKTGPATSTAGQDIVYTITVTNGGPDLATAAVWNDLLPAGTTFVDLTGPSDWICTTPNPGDAGAVECQEGTFAFEGSAIFTLTVNVAPCSGNMVVSNTATVTSATTDTDPSNNSSTANTTVTDPGTCDDGNACTTNDACSGNVCTGGPALNCDDSNACTDDSCDSILGCQHTNNTAACDDGNVCTNGDTCSGGACAGTNAPSGQACTSDGNVCTTDACDGSGVCAHVNNTVACDDGNACTTNDTCGGGTCNGGAGPDCNDGNVCTNDSCNPATGCVNACNNSCNTKGQGYWKRLCHGPHSGDFYTQRDVDCVNNSCTFAGVQTIPQMCDKLDQHGHAPNDQGGKCAKAEEKFMTLLLNKCRCRVQGSQSINSRCGPHQTVDESIANSDANLCNPARTRDDCEHADCASTEISNGEALWSNTLRIIRVGQSVKLTWSPPYAQPDESNNYTYKIWRRVPVAPGQSPVAFTQIGTVHGTNLTYTDVNAATRNYEYEITAD